VEHLAISVDWSSRKFLERRAKDPMVRRPRALEPLLLPARRNDLFVKHPVLGDLNLEEWLHFHAWHCAHHEKQIRERLP